MDTGNNGQMLTLNIESIAEVKILTQGYQAEFGRSSGLQITAVTKSGTNRFRGSALRPPGQLGLVHELVGERQERRPEAEVLVQDARLLDRRSGWQARRHRTSCSSSTATSIVRRTTRSTAATRFVCGCRPRLERAGDFSQTLDNNGALFNLIHNPASSSPCTTTDQSGCFADGGVLGRIPASSLYSTGLAVLNRYPLPSLTQAAQHQLQPPDRSAQGFADRAAAGDPPGLPVVVEAARHRQVLRPASGAAHDARDSSPDSPTC